MNQLNDELRVLLKSNIRARIKFLPLDYFSWGRDKRFNSNIPSNKERLFKFKNKILNLFNKKNFLKAISKYITFNKSFQLMSDEYSQILFKELIIMQVLGEDNFRLSSFDQKMIDSYENSYKKYIKSKSYIKAYGRRLHLVKLNKFSIYTSLTAFTYNNIGRLYRYSIGKNIIEVQKNDIVLDLGTGWGDTSIIFSSLTGPKGQIHTFDILDQAKEYLKEQLNINKSLKNIKFNKLAASDSDNDFLYIDNIGPGAFITDEKETSKRIKTIKIDTYVKNNNLKSVDFIKMDIEGSELNALMGAKETIKKFNPKLAISVYHKWNDLDQIPQLINSFNKNYLFYLDCLTGFGGESVLYCYVK